MNMEIYLANDIQLQIAQGTRRGESYPTGKIQKGLVLLDHGIDLSEEAVGFGVPILKRGLQTIFPGEVELYPLKGSSSQGITARYTMNLEERISRKGNMTISNPLLYAAKNRLAALIRQIPILRRLLTGTSNFLRSSLALQTIYLSDGFYTQVTLIYSIDAELGKVKVELTGEDFLSKKVSEIILMNEQGAHHFDQYQDSNGINKVEDEIGCWDQVKAAEASFIDRTHQISFSLPQVKGASLYRGRELVNDRLAWAGFGYSFSPELKPFAYEMKIKKLV
jgi:hypothetical protein